MTENQDVQSNNEIVSQSVYQEDDSVLQHDKQQQTQDQISDKEHNFRALREQVRAIEEEKKRIAQERDEYKKAVFASINNNKSTAVDEQQDDYEEIAEDDWTTRKYTERLVERRAREIVNKELKAAEEKRRQEELPNLIKKNYSDFESVVTQENIDYLKRNKPHVIATLSSTSDPYSQAAAAYEYVKAFCPNQNVSDDVRRANENAQKVGTLGNANAGSPLSQAKMFESGKLTPELQKKLYREMIEASKQ